MKYKIFDGRTSEGIKKAERYKMKIENEGYTPFVEWSLSDRIIIGVKK